jgi:lipopolysaccharide export system protein LptA
MRRRNTPDTGARAGVCATAFCAGLAGLMLIMIDATRARCAQTQGAAATPAAAPSAAARPGGTRKGGASKAEGDAKDAGQNSHFGMMKFSADNGPIQIKADSLDLDYKNNTVEFKGTVHATQSGTTLTSKTLKVLYGAKFGQIKQVIALGDVKMTQGGRWATGQRAVLDEVKHTVEMTGTPVIHDGPDSVAGRRIIIYLDTEKSFVEGATAVIFPRNGGKTDHEAAD